MIETRFSANGERFYRTDRADRTYPSVTTILSATASEHSKKALLSWAQKNPGGREAAANRGSDIHKAAEDYIRGKPISIHPDHQIYWRGIAEQLDKYDEFLWSERPLKPQWKHVTGEDGISRIWSHRYGYAGVPDLIGRRGGVVIIADFKTSTGPYCRHFPQTKEDRRLFTGWSKYQKVGMQLAGYALAAEETLGIHVDCAQVMVATPELKQNFLIHGDELLRHRTRFLQRVRRYWELKAMESEAQAEAAAQLAGHQALAIAA